MVTDQHSTEERDTVVEQRIREALAERQGMPLPAVHAWARALHTGTRRVSRVLHKLRAEGLIDFSPRRRARHASAGLQLPPTRATLTGDLYDRIRQAIEDGRYPMGSRLPKVDHFGVEHGASYNTVRRSLARLCCDGLVHRARHALVAGPAPLVAHSQRAADPVILMMQGEEDWWERTLANEWLAPFSLGFMREVNLAATQVTPVFAQRPASPFLVHGQEQIASLVAELLGQSWDYHYVGHTTIPAVVRDLVRFGRPVVWFDHADEPRGRDDPFDQKVYARMLAEPRMARLFTRVHYDHDAALRLALGALHNLGHRRIGVPWFAGDDRRLAEVRLAGLRHVAPEYPGLELIEVSGAGNPFAEHDAVATPATPGRWRRALTPQGRAFVTSRSAADRDPQLKRLLRLATVIMDLAFDRGATAIIAPNDVRARNYYLSLRTLGLRVPTDVSLLSFDASPKVLYPWQISSVDFGFGNLAYCAYHLIMEDVPVPRKRSEVGARCRLNHMGSLGPPTSPTRAGSPSAPVPRRKPRSF
jgi:DNA-binding FadR family transcriptional regulator